MRRVHVFISGRVQGVWFRSSTKKVASELGVSGWVRNLTDGRVEAVFEGDDEKVSKCLEWCREGPPGAVVTDVEVIDEVPEGERDFKIIY